MTMSEGMAPLDGEHQHEHKSLHERYGWRDPAANEWTAGDIAFGWLCGGGIVLAGSLVFGLLIAGPSAFIVVIYGAIIGIPALTLYGVPVAIAAATLLRRVERGWMHHATFAALGAIGGALTVAVAGSGWGDGTWVLVTPSIATGAATAVLGRGFAKRRAIRTRGERAPRRAA